MTPSCLEGMTQNDWSLIARFGADIHKFALLQIDKLEIEKEFSRNGKSIGKSDFS